MAKLVANSGDPDQMPCSAASDLSLLCLPSTLLWVSRLQWVNGDLKPEYKKTTKRTTMVLTTDIDSHVLIF